MIELLMILKLKLIGFGLIGMGLSSAVIEKCGSDGVRYVSRSAALMAIAAMSLFFQGIGKIADQASDANAASEVAASSLFAVALVLIGLSIGAMRGVSGFACKKCG
jgi:hypothetical protein